MVRDSYPAGLDPNQAVDEQSLAPYQTFFVAQKMIPVMADLSKLVDTSFAQAAVRALGPYQ
jgi:NitT/TauT family transport system substrate-binding protein